MIVSVYDGDDDGIENRLKFWLRLDSWPVRDACWLLLDVDPDTVEYVDDNNLAHLRTLKGKLVKSFTRVDNESLEKIKLLDRYLSNYFDLVRIIGGSYQVDRNLEFEIFKVIEKALSKNIEIPWYEWAVKKGFYVPKNEPATKQEAEKPLSVRTENNYLRLIFKLANGIKDFNPKKPYEAAKLIIDETGIENISRETIANYISKAHELESKKQD